MGNKGPDIPLFEQIGALSAATLKKFKEKFAGYNKALEQIDNAKASMAPNSTSFKDMISKIAKTFNGPDSTQKTNDAIQTLTGGVSVAKANEMLAKDVNDSEKSIKAVMKTAGVTTIPQNVFDGLVSYHNQVGDISYAFVKGEKIDLLSLYQQKDWERVASFIILDERDRPRRIREAAMIATNSYGPAVNVNAIIAKGFSKMDEDIAKGILNKQTGADATDQQLVAAANSYWNHTNSALPSVPVEFNSAVVNNNIAEAVKRQTVGPWPY